MGLITQVYQTLLDFLLDEGNYVWKLWLLLIITLFGMVYYQYSYHRYLPPGPWGLPLLGCLPLFSEPPSPNHYLKYVDKYGDIFSVKMGTSLIICISSAKLLKEVFSRSDSTGRPHTPLNNLLGGFGIVLSEGNLWKRQRQFLYDKFRVLGVKLCSNPKFEKYILIELDDLSRILNERYDGVPVEPSELLGRHVHNVILQLMMNFRFQEDDQDFVTYNKHVSDGMTLYGSVIMAEYIKYYKFLPGKREAIEKIKMNLLDVSQFHREHIEYRAKQREAIAARSEPADLLDYYLAEMEKEKEHGINIKKSIFPETDPMQQLIQVMNDLFSAGMETARTTLIWTLVILMREPEVAKKAREELKKVINVGEMVTLDLRPKLAYVEAIIYETMRRVGVVPLGTTHVNNSNWTIGEYLIPAGSRIVPLLHAMGRDTEVYPDPLMFKPDRFLKNGKLYMTDTFVQFGIGQRMCLGAQLARMELFLFLSNLINNYDFYMPEGKPVPELAGFMATTHTPNKFEMCFKKRIQ